MPRFNAVAIAGLLLAAAQPALAEVANLTNSATGANKEQGQAEVKKKLIAACTERKGKPNPASFEVVFERTTDKPDVPKPYYVDGKMKCDLP